MEFKVGMKYQSKDKGFSVKPSYTILKITEVVGMTGVPETLIELSIDWEDGSIPAIFVCNETTLFNNINSLNLKLVDDPSVPVYYSQVCKHEPKRYVGFTEVYDYCVKCNERLIT